MGWRSKRRNARTRHKKAYARRQAKKKAKSGGGSKYRQNPANVRAGIDASQIAVDSKSQKTATRSQIKEYQATGSSPAMQKAVEATQKQRENIAKLRQEQKLRRQGLTQQTASQSVNTLAAAPDSNQNNNLQSSQTNENIKQYGPYESIEPSKDGMMQYTVGFTAKGTRTGDMYEIKDTSTNQSVYLSEGSTLTSTPVESKYKLDTVKEKIKSNKYAGPVVEAFEDYSEYQREADYNIIGLNIGGSPLPNKEQAAAIGSVVGKVASKVYNVEEDVATETLTKAVAYPKQNPYKTALVAGSIAATGGGWTVSSFALRGAGTVAGGVIGVDAGLGYGEISAPTEQKVFIQDQEVFKGAMQAGQYTEYKDAGLLKKTVGSVPGLRLLSGGGDFEKGVRDYYSNMGLTGTELDNAVAAASRQRVAGEVGASVGTFGVNVASELIGTGLISSSSAFATEKAVTAGKTLTFGYKFAATAPYIGAAGVVEGAAVEIAVSKARYQDQDIKNIAIAGVAGGVSAAVIGGTIAASSKSSLLGKTSRAVGYYGDPYEKIADVTAEKWAKELSLVTGVPTITPTFTTTVPTPVTYSKRKTTTTFGLARTPTTTYSPTSTKSIISEPVITPTQTQSTVLTSTSTPVTVSSSTRTATTPTSIFSTIFTPTTTSTTTTTQTNTAVSTPVTITIPFLQNPLILPAGGFKKFTTGLGSLKSKKVSQYAPSVEANLFKIKGFSPKIITGTEIRPLRRKKKRSKRKKK